MAKILIIDDDAALREVVRLSLETTGYEVIEASDGHQGVELACAQLPDLILCDVRMERMDGYGTLAELRQNSMTAALPFILMTGQADHAGMRQGMELGADDYLPKPFKVDQLIAAVGARLKKHQTMRNQAAKQLAALRANLSLSLPHELLTPLNGILGFADILESDAGSLGADEVASMAGAIRDSAERLHRLIQNFLLLAHLEIQGDDSGASVEEGELVSLRDWVKVAAVKVADDRERRQDLKLELGDVQARIGEEHCTKIVSEVVDNAFKFSEKGSRVEVRLEQQATSAVLSVSDEGRGMRPEHIAEIGAYMQFERRFYEQQGSGLGLTIARRLARFHGGRLGISSETGRGTTVELMLPSAIAKA